MELLFYNIDIFLRNFSFFQFIESLSTREARLVLSNFLAAEVQDIFVEIPISLAKRALLTYNENSPLMLLLRSSAFFEAVTDLYSWFFFCFVYPDTWYFEGNGFRHFASRKLLHIWNINTDIHIWKIHHRKLNHKVKIVLIARSFVRCLIWSGKIYQNLVKVARKIENVPQNGKSCSELRVAQKLPNRILLCLMTEIGTYW